MLKIQEHIFFFQKFSKKSRAKNEYKGNMIHKEEEKYVPANKKKSFEKIFF